MDENQSSTLHVARDTEKYQGKSLVNIYPRNNNVLLRIEFEESILALSSDKKDSSADQPVKFFVAGFGSMVKDLILGEQVVFRLEQAYHSIPVKGNMQDIKSLKETYSKMPRKDLNEAIAKSERVKVIEYGIFPEFLIVANRD